MCCTGCGNKNDVGAEFCKSCDKPIAESMPSARRLEGEPTETVGLPPHIPNCLVQAILVTIFCYLPFGIVSIVYAAQVYGKLQAEDIVGARQASANARSWAWVSLGVGLASIAPYGLHIIDAVGLGSS